MRLICYSSGAWPCGIANYHRQLVPFLEQSFSVATRTLPTTPVLRDRPWALARQRRLYADLAEQSSAYDVALLQFITFWNGNRPGENALPIFVSHLRRPTVVVLHEWPPAQEREPDQGRWARRFARQALLRTFAGPQADPAWLNAQFFSQMSHFVVHSGELRDRLLESGVREERITLVVHPPYELGTVEGTPLDPALAQRLDGRRVVLLFGFPHPRKSYELAVTALRDLPNDILLVIAGSTEGTFRSTYINSLVELARATDVSDRLLITGEVSDRALSELFARTDVALAPFSYATGSGSIGYFIGAGLPIVASDIPSNVSVREAGAGIRLFHQGDAADLASTVADLLGKPEAGVRLREQNRQFARTHSFHSLSNLIRDRIRDAAESRGASS